MAATRRVKGQIATRGILAYAQRHNWQCGGADTNVYRQSRNTHTRTHTAILNWSSNRGEMKESAAPFGEEEEAEEGGLGRMGACRVGGRGCEERERTDRLTD